MTSNAKFGVILPAAGSGTRFGGGDKLLVNLGGKLATGSEGHTGKSVLQRTVELFAARSDVSTIVIVTAPDRFEPYRTHLIERIPALNPVGGGARHLSFVAGGRERWESVLFGLRHLAQGAAQGALGASAGPPQFVAIHDAARPLCSNAVVDAAFQAAVDIGGSVPCVAEPATLKRRGADGCVEETVNRRGLFQAQTPQCFDLSKLLMGYEALLASNRLQDVTDDAQVFERMGWPVKITEGSPVNMKITTAEDVALANAIVQADRTA